MNVGDIVNGDEVTLTVRGKVKSISSNRNKEGFVIFDGYYFTEISFDHVLGVERHEPSWVDGDQILISGQDILWERREGVWVPFASGRWQDDGYRYDSYADLWVSNGSGVVLRRGGKRV